MRIKQDEISGWGNFPKGTCNLVRPEKVDHIPFPQEEMISRGLGRSYGDAAINDDRQVVLMERMNRFLEFDENKGILRAEAGCTLEEVLDVVVPKGWFVPVTPGTKYVTLGGCVAADVHGKNHHLDGSIGLHVKELVLTLADGTHKKCSANCEPEIFWATVGGMGLTGIITEITLELIPIESAYVAVSHYDAYDFDKMLELLSDSSVNDKYSVAWLDCLSTGKNFGRGVLMAGHHAQKDELSTKEGNPLKIKKKKTTALPFNIPTEVLNSYTISAFNNIYYALQKNKGSFITDYDSYFYPLDAIRHWNRMYGKKGFIQYQCVVPTDNADRSLKAILGEITLSRRGSFLAVLKRFGKENPGYLSFPKEGFTLALDLPVTDSQTVPFVHQLDKIVLQFGGRVYLAKDACMDSSTFRQMYPRYTQWKTVKKSIDPTFRFQSNLSRRLKMEESS